MFRDIEVPALANRTKCTRRCEEAFTRIPVDTVADTSPYPLLPFLGVACIPVEISDAFSRAPFDIGPDAARRILPDIVSGFLGVTSCILSAAGYHEIVGGLF